MEELVIYTPTRINNEESFSGAKKSFDSFYQFCQYPNLKNIRLMVNDNSAPEFKKSLHLYLRNLTNNLDFIDGGDFVDSCNYMGQINAKYAMYFVVDMIFCYSYDFITPAMKFLALKENLLEVYFRLGFNAINFKSWKKTIGGKVKSFDGNLLKPIRIDEENTGWYREEMDTLKINEYHERFGLNACLFDLSRLKQFLPIKKLPSLRRPGDSELYMIRRKKIDSKFTVGYINMQAFSYHGDTQRPDGFFKDVPQLVKKLCEPKLLS